MRRKADAQNLISHTAGRLNCLGKVARSGNLHTGQIPRPWCKRRVNKALEITAILTNA